MKKIASILALALAIYSCKTESKESNNTTSLRIKNSNSDTAIVYLTLGSNGTGWVNNVNGIFGITSTDTLQGSFKLPPNDSLTYTPENGLALSGNFSFGYPPINCPVGITLYEFTLNNSGTINMAQETVEISCVAGVSSLGKYTLYGGGNWEANPNYLNVRTFYNDSMNKNTCLVGVFPYGCTNCTNTAGMPTCITNPETPQSQNICNISRNADSSGGVVKVEFLGLINNDLKKQK